MSVLVAPLTPREKLSVSVFLLGRRDLTHTLTSVDTRQLQERRGSGPELREKQAVPFPTLCHVGSIEAPSSVTPPRKSKQRNVARQRHEKISGVWSCRSLQGTCKSYDTTSVCGLGRKTRPSVFTTRAVLNLMQTGWILPLPRILPGIPALLRLYNCVRCWLLVRDMR